MQLVEGNLLAAAEVTSVRAARLVMNLMMFNEYWLEEKMVRTM